MEGDGFENGIMGAFESSVDESETTAERREDVSESLLEGMGEAALRAEELTADSKERKAAEAVDVIRGVIKKVVEYAEKGIKPSDEEEAAAEADFEGALKDVEDNGCLKEMRDMLINDDMFFEMGLFDEFEKRGVLSIYDIAKKCSSERLNDSSLRYRIRREVETMSDQKEDLTDEQLEFLGLLSQKGINLLETSLSMDLFSVNGDDEQENQKAWQDEQKRVAEHFYEQLRDHGLVKKDDVMEVYSGLFGHYGGEAKSFIKASTFLEDFVRDNPDNLPIEDDYWLKSISEKGIDYLLDFRSKVSHGDISIFDKYDFEQKVVNKAFFELFKSDSTYFSSRNTFNKAVEKRAEDPETLEVILQVLDEYAPAEGSTYRDSKLIRYVVRNKEAFDDLARSGKLEKYSKLKRYEILDEASAGGLTEKRRLQYLFGDYTVGDSQFDENGEPLDSFYESVLNRDEEIFGALDKRGKLLAIRGCLESGGSLDKFRVVETELLKESGAFSEAELGFIKIMSSIEGNLPYALRELKRGEVDKYYGEEGLKEEFFTELMMWDEGSRSVLCKMNPAVLRELGVSDDEFARLIRRQRDAGYLQYVELADLDEDVMKKAFGDDELAISYLQFLKVFNNGSLGSNGFPQSDQSQKHRSMIARYVRPENVAQYFKDGKVTEEFIDGPLMEIPLDRMSCFTQETRSQLGIDRGAFLDLVRSRYFGSTGSIVDLYEFLSKDEVEEVFADDENIKVFLAIANGIRNKIGEFRFITFDKIGDYFSSNGSTDEFFVECVKRGKIGVLDEFSDEQKEQYGFSESTKALLLGVSFKNILGGEDTEVDESNVLAALARFIKMDADDWLDASEDDLRVKEAFSETNIKNKNLAMQMLRKEYEQYLKTGVMPVGLRLFAEYMHGCDGAGPLTQIEMFLDYCGELGKANDDEIAKGTSSIEKRIRKWDDQEKASYYSISAEIMKADPEIYKEFLSVFDRISEEEDFKVFVKEIFPLYRAKLALLKEYDYKGDSVGNGLSTANYSGLDKEKLMNDLHLALLPFSFESRGDNEGNEAYRERRRKGIERVKSNIFNEISGLFQEKFGILPEAIPDELDRDAMRAIEDMVLYLSNINQSNEEKKNIIGFFLALQLKKGEHGGTAWDDLRAGREIDPSMFLGSETVGSVARALERSKETDPITSENVGIANSERLSAFREALQGETSEIRVGSVLTVDTKLQTISQNIVELMDPDLYDDPMDKTKIKLLMNHEPKMINGVATKLWMRESDKSVTFSAEEAEVAQILETMLVGNGIELTPENINKHLQRGFKDLSKIAAAYKMIESSNISEIVGDLQDMLMPSGEVAEIFAELGEEFQPHSGILALSADIEFLESIVMKAEKADMLSGDEEEKKRKIEVVKGYLKEVREKFAQIDALYNEVVKKFENISIKNSEEQESSSRRKLVTKLQEISAMIGKREGGVQSTITTVCSNRMPVIIENMRACLSCKTKGCNNDTDLTFGEGYKFYLYSTGSAGETGSVSDEIVYFVPVGEEGDQRMAFVMDLVYGNKSGDIYLNHAATVIKKAKGLKRKFPEARISIFLTNASASSCGTSLSKGLLERLGIPQGAEVIERSALKVNIPESGFGDHYIEIGGDARTSGERDVSGIEIIL
ncbi:MAG: hypothetical protein K6F57_04300 [Candidatus Saccharibacteria bacterium]|nr:hypothetical protein [Candidatus Saccharibacteria bacterium]